MGRNKQTYVQQAFDEGWICVFPTEVASRSHLLDYALQSEQGAILSSRAISFDTFRSFFLVHHASLQPANTLIRQLFIQQILDQNVPLQYFLRDDYPESRTRLAGSLPGMLPALKDAIQAPVLSVLPPDLQRDVLVLYQLYTQFLEEHQLFEPRFEQIREPDDWDATKRYCILFSDTIAEARTLYDQLGKPSYLELRPTPSVQRIPDMEVFSNHIQEIRTCLRRVRSLLMHQVPAHSIIIGCAAPDQLLPVLEEEARLYDVPLVVREGKSALAYSSGRFLSLLQEVYVQQFSLESLKSLLLDPSIPYLDRDFHLRFIRKAVDRSILQGSLQQADQFTDRLADPALVDWYRRFKLSILDIIASTQVDELRRKLNHFQDTYFISTQWVGVQGEDVYAFCLDSLDQIEKALQQVDRRSYPQLYSFWLSYLKTRSYVPQQKVEGISVYGWPQASVLKTEHLFVLGLDQESSSCVSKPLSFLPSYLQGEVRKEIDTTNAQFCAVFLQSDDLHLSCHLGRYEAELLPPAFFLEQEALIEQSESPNLHEDPYLAELSLYRGNPIGSVRRTECQKQWFEQARSTSLSMRNDDYARYPMACSPKERLQHAHGQAMLIDLSATGLDWFSRCPYAYLCRYVLGVSRQDYDVQLVDHRQIGTLLHRVYQRFFSSLDAFDPMQLQAYRKQLHQIFTETLEELYGKQGPRHSIHIWIVSEFSELITRILEEESRLFPFARSIGFEKQLEMEFGPLFLQGRIDRIIALEGSQQALYAIIDYKKSEVPFKKVKTGIKSYQLPLYRLLVDSVLQKRVANGSYYSIKDARYYSLWDGDASEEALVCDQALEEQLSRFIEAVETGSLMATPSKEHCAGCEYRSLCRRRYATL
ncbi:MAG: PD-(D/E)XK nuclease family protein [Sphaerochaeta sp.]|uniref:PD-(D/E)XK nuclease family protein n=1 Tax=Sphaerochaeta sp. TaxID=1972642 RepID=UPI003D106F5F